jgi:PTH1 family peptidyl-tRNA hydrolase
MALFQKFQRNNQLIRLVDEQPEISSAEGGFVQLIVGLGNIGEKYEKNRHNVGFLVLDKYREQNGFPDWQEKSKFKALISEDFVAGKKVILAKPTTLMNLSGESVKALKDFYKVPNSDITVIHDELDLPFGTAKEKDSGGSAGNNGLKSLISLVGDDFKRIRIGIQNELKEKMDAADFVLSNFSKEEQKKLPDIIREAIAKLS